MALWDVPGYYGMFQGCSGVVPGCSGLFQGCSGDVLGCPVGVLGCSGVFRGVLGCSGAVPGFTDTRIENSPLLRSQISPEPLTSDD